LNRALLAACVLAGSVGASQAAALITLEQLGGNVVATLSGSVNLDGLA
jgi:hypothetical protein